MACKHLFTKDYLVFFYREQSPEISIHKEVNFGNQNVQTGNILTSICNDIDIPETCGEAGKAKLVFVTSTGACPVIIKQDNSWNYEIGNFETRETFINMMPSKSQADTYSVNYKFVCSPNTFIENINVLYFADKNSFEIEIHGQKSCAYSVSFLKSLSEHPLVTGGIFLTIGIVLCFLGLKFYKDMLMFFIPTMIAILCFYLYLTVVEKSIEQNNKWLSIFFMLFLLVVVIALVIMFTNVIYFILSFVASYELGMLLHKFFEAKYEFFKQDYTEFILIGLLFVAFVGFYLKMKDYFIIFCTSFIGAFFFILAISYFGISEFDFLFNLEMGKFKDLAHVEQEYLNFLAVFFLIFLTGGLTQIMFFKRPHKGSNHDGNHDLRIELRNV